MQTAAVTLVQSCDKLAENLLKKGVLVSHYVTVEIKTYGKGKQGC